MDATMFRTTVAVLHFDKCVVSAVYFQFTVLSSRKKDILCYGTMEGAIMDGWSSG